MQRNWILGLTMALTLVATTAASFSGVEPDRPRGSKAVAFKGNKWGEGKEQFSALFLKRLGEELALDESTNEKLARSFERRREQWRALKQERKALKTELRNAVNTDAPESEIETTIAKVEALRNRHRKLTADQQAELRQILGTRGFARYMLLRHKFRRDTRGKCKGYRGHNI